MRIFDRTGAAVLILSVALPWGGCRNGAGVRVLKLAHTNTSMHPMHKALVYFAQRVDELSGHTLRIDVYAGGQLGGERESIELLRAGSIDMAKVSAGAVPGMGVFNRPYLFRDRAHVRRVLDGEIGMKLLRAGETPGVRGLCYYDAGFRNFFFGTKEARSPAGMKGLKIRAIGSPNVVSSLGAEPAAMALGELYTALQEGVIDGSEATPVNFYYSRYCEAARFYLLDEHAAPPDVLVIGSRAWDSLSELQREWVRQAARESAAYQRELWDESERDVMNRIRGAGVVVVTPEREEFRRLLLPAFSSPKEDGLFRAIQGDAATADDAQGVEGARR